jgi:hypothetical protein
MNASGHVAQLLHDRVPLALLFDLAGYGPTPAELLLEGPVVVPAQRTPADLVPPRLTAQAMRRSA